MPANDTQTDTNKTKAEQAKDKAAQDKANLTGTPTEKSNGTNATEQQGNTKKIDLTAWQTQKTNMVNWLKDNVAKKYDFDAGSLVNHLQNDLLTRDEQAFGIAQDFLKDAQSHLEQLARNGGATVTSSNPANKYVNDGTPSDNVNADLATLIGWSPSSSQTPQGNSQSGTGD